MTNVVVSSGFEDQGFGLVSGNTMWVLSGGISHETTVSSGGRLLVAAGGESLDDAVLSGGLEVISSGAAGGSLTVSAGGTLEGAGVLSGASIISGLVSGLTVVSGTGGFGSITIGDLGVASGVIIDNSLATVQLGGTARGLMALDGGQVHVSAGGNTTGVVVLAGSLEDVFGSDRGAAISSGGLQFVDTGGHATGTVVSDGGDQYVFSTGVASGSVVLSSGSQLVQSGGRASGTVVSNGGNEIVSAGGTAQGSVVASGGSEQILSGALASAFRVLGGGSLTVSSGGVLRVGATGTSINSGSIDVQSSSEMDLAGALDNSGIIDLDDLSNVEITAKATLTGSGTIDMVGTQFLGLSPSDILDNESNTIEGYGQFGGGNLTVINRGTIDANQADGLTLNANLTINTGLIEATNNGVGLYIQGPINNSGGTIEANGADVLLNTMTVISGGLLSGAIVSGVLGEFNVFASVELDGTMQAVTNKAVVNVQQGTKLTLAGEIDNAGVISMTGDPNDADLIIDGATVTLTGSGTVMMSDNGTNFIFGDATAFTNVLDNVEGSGEIGEGKLVLRNSGTIDASGAIYSIVIDATTATNAGLMEATEQGGLVIVTAVDNSGGLIAANGGDVFLEGGADIVGGTLKSSPNSTFVVTATSTSVATLNGVASQLTNNAEVDVREEEQLNLAGAIVNNGVILLDGGLDTTTLMIAAANVTLTGKGTIELSDSSDNLITGAAPADVFDNDTNTIEGSGEIGGSQLTLINRGTIDASGSASALQIDATKVANAGLIEATGAGGLDIKGQINNSGGRIFANHGAVFLSGASISGGVLSSTSDNFIYAGGATLDGTASAVGNAASIRVDNGLQLRVDGAIRNAGTITLETSGENTDLVIDAATATFTGTGVVELSDDPDSRIFGAVAADVLDNETNTIEGAGQIGVGQLTLINRGTIDATGAINTLIIDTISATNTGLIEATTSPGLIVESAINNSGGVIGAFGGDVQILSGAAISGGTFEGQGGGDNLIEVLSGGSVISASVGDGAIEIVSAGATQRAVSVGLDAAIEVLSGAKVADSVVLNGGTEVISAGAFASGAVVSQGGALVGSGSIWQTVRDQGIVADLLVRSGAVLSVITGGGTQDVRVASGGLEVLSGGRALSAVVSSGGVLRALSGGTATGTLLHSGGTETIGVGGKAVGTVLSGGVEYDYGAASATVIRAGGHEIVAAHGSASGSVISASGQEVVSSGGATLAATLFNLGSLIVSSGGTVSGGLTIHAGKVALDGAMGAGQVVDFVGAAGTLKLDNLAAFQAKISGLSTIAEKIDLGGFTFSAGETVTWTQAGTSGTLKVHDGAKTASLTLIGTYVTGDFTLSNDSHGGTFVVDPPVSSLAVAAPAAAQFVQAVAGFDAGRGGLAAIHSGGTASMIAPPLLNATASGAGHG